MKQEQFSKIQSTLPNSPGIYKYYSFDKQLLYIGKAKNLRKRVSSYFNKNNHSFKTNELVRQIEHIEFTIVHSEHDALLLENALIKEFKPKYNILLKDDKAYPYIVIKKEPFSRVFLTRRKINDGSTYLGPYTSTARVRDILEFIKQHIQLRNCTLSLTKNNIEKGKFKVCLEYHLGNCKGPCVGLQTQAEYDNGLDQIRHILKGNLSGIINEYKQKQKVFVEELAFEKAEFIQQKINDLKNYQAKSVIVSPNLGDLDVFALADYEGDMVVSYLAVRNGTISNSKTASFKLMIDESKEDLLAHVITNFQSIFDSDAKELILPFPIEFGFEGYKIIVPKTGEKKEAVIAGRNQCQLFH